MSERFGGRRMRCRQCGSELEVPVATEPADGEAFTFPDEEEPGGGRRRNKSLEETAVLEGRGIGGATRGESESDAETEAATAGEAPSPKTRRGGRRAPGGAGRKGPGDRGRRGVAARGRSRAPRERKGRRAAAEASGGGRSRTFLFAGAGVVLIAVAVVVWAVFFRGGEVAPGEDVARGDAGAPLPGSESGGPEGATAAEGTATSATEELAADVRPPEPTQGASVLALPPAPAAAIDLIPAEAGLIVSADIARLKALRETFGGEDGAPALTPQAGMVSGQAEMLRFRAEQLEGRGFDLESIERVSVAISFPPLPEVLALAMGGGQAMEMETESGAVDPLAGAFDRVAKFIEGNVLVVLEGKLDRRELVEAEIIEEYPRRIGVLTAHALRDDVAAPPPVPTEPPAFPEGPGGRPDPLRDAPDAAPEDGGFEPLTGAPEDAEPVPASGGAGPKFYAAFFQSGVAVLGGEPSLEKVAAILEGRGSSCRENERLAGLTGGFGQTEPFSLAVSLPEDYSGWLHEMAKGNPQARGMLQMFSVAEPPRVEGLFLAVDGSPEDMFSVRLRLRCAAEQGALDIQKVAAGFSQMGMIPVPLKGGVSGSQVEFDIELSMNELQAMMMGQPSPPPGGGAVEFDLPGGRLPGGFGPGTGAAEPGLEEPGDASLEGLGDDLSLPGEPGSEGDLEEGDLEELDLEELDLGEFDLDDMDLDLEDAPGSEDGS